VPPQPSGGAEPRKRAGVASVACVGIAVLDRIFSLAHLPTAPGKFFAHRMVEVGGGPAASAAVAIDRLGGAASLYARLGDDAAAAAIIAELEAYRVDASGVRRMPDARSTTAAILVERSGERLIVTHADPCLPADPSWLPLDRIAAAGCLLADVRWPQGAAAALAAAAARGLPSVLDADANPEPEAVRPLLSLATHIVFSEPGIAQATGLADPAQALAAARRLAPGWLAVTLGQRGALSLEPGGIRHWPAFAVAAVDTIGAGDVFHGALALALAEAKPLPEAMRFAAAAAALKCARPGGRAGIPDRAAVARLLEGRGE
jgi:sulfofructose kinase